MRTVPVLLRRLGELESPSLEIEVRRPPVRTPRSKLLKPRELERAVHLAALNAGDEGAVLVLLDADDDCPKELAQEITERAAARLGARPLSVVLAKREYEAWFIAGIRSLAGKRGIRRDVETAADPEGVRGAKEWLSARMMGGRRYSETTDQAALSQLVDVAQAASAPSFDKLRREIRKLGRLVAART